MIKHPPRERFVAMPMAALAGFVDAIAFLHLGGYFVSFMTGNTTRLAASLAEDPTLALIPLALIALFVGGVVMGTLLRRRFTGVGPAGVMTLVACLLFTAAILQHFGIFAPAIAFLALAMGAENTVFERDGEVSIGVTYMTGTLVKMGQRMAAGLSGGNRTDWIWYFGLWLALSGGALAGSFVYLWVGLAAVWFAAGFAAILAGAVRWTRIAQA